VLFLLILGLWRENMAAFERICSGIPGYGSGTGIISGWGDKCGLGEFQISRNSGYF